MNTQRADAEMRRYYAERAGYYDRVYFKPERQDDLAVLNSWVPAQFSGCDVLEVACGTGYWTARIAATANRLVATDATPAALDVARTRPGCETVQFVEADAYALPAELGLFDAAFAGLWLSHVPKSRIHDFFTGLHARLKPGARVVLIDNSKAQCLELPLVERDAEGNTYQYRPLDDGSVHRVLKNFPTESELHAAMAGLGRNGTFRAYEHFWVFDYEAC